MTEKETTLLEMFRSLDKYEQNMIMGKISELILNRRRERIHLFEDKIKYYPVVFIYIL